MKGIVDCLKEHAKNLLAGKGAAEEMVRKDENEIGTVFADDFRSCLLAFGTFAYDGHEFTGISTLPRLSVASVTMAQKALNPDIPADWYVIEETNMDGIIIWQSPNGVIYLSQYKGRPVKTADSLSEFLRLGSE